MITSQSENISGESIGDAALINFFVQDAALIRGWRLIEGGAYSSKYATPQGKDLISFAPQKKQTVFLVLSQFKGSRVETRLYLEIFRLLFRYYLSNIIIIIIIIIIVKSQWI